MGFYNKKSPGDNNLADLGNVPKSELDQQLISIARALGFEHPDQVTWEQVHAAQEGMDKQATRDHEVTKTELHRTDVPQNPRHRTEGE